MKIFFIISLLLSLQAFSQTEADAIRFATIDSEQEATAMKMGANNFLKDLTANMDQLSDDQKDQMIQYLNSQNERLEREYRTSSSQKNFAARGVSGFILPIPLLAPEVEIPSLAKVLGLHVKAQLNVAAIKFMDPSDMTAHYKFSLLAIGGAGATATLTREKTNVKVNFPMGYIEIDAHNGSSMYVENLSDLNGVYAGGGLGTSISVFGLQGMAYRNLKGNVHIVMVNPSFGSDRAPLYGKAEGIYAHFFDSEHDSYQSAVAEAAKTAADLFYQPNDPN